MSKLKPPLGSPTRSDADPPSKTPSFPGRGNDHWPSRLGVSVEKGMDVGG